MMSNFFLFDKFFSLTKEEVNRVNEKFKKTLDGKLFKQIEIITRDESSFLNKIVGEKIITVELRSNLIDVKIKFLLGFGFEILENLHKDISLKFNKKKLCYLICECMDIKNEFIFNLIKEVEERQNKNIELDEKYTESNTKKNITNNIIKKNNQKESNKIDFLEKEILEDRYIIRNSKPGKFILKEVYIDELYEYLYMIEEEKKKEEPK